jgi:hypothetical protein
LISQAAAKEAGINNRRQGRPTGGGAGAGGATGTIKKTLGGQFKTQLTSLMSILNQSQPHFVRCMKSNMEKLGRKFDSHVMLTQLRYSGLIEVCRIRQNGFPHRLTFEKFLKTYWMLNSSSKTAPELAKALEKEGYFTSEQYFVGHTKIFLKFETGLLLEQVRNQQVGSCAIKFEKIIRGWLMRRRYLKILNSLQTLQFAITTNDQLALEAALSQVTTTGAAVDFSVIQHSQVYKLALSTLHRLKLEEEMKQALENALKTSNLSLLLVAVERATAMDPPPPLMAPLLKTCQDKILELQVMRESLDSEEMKSIPITPNAPFPPPPPPPRRIMRSTLKSSNEIVLTSLQTISPIITTTGIINFSDIALPPPPEQEPPIDDPAPPPPPPLSPAESPLPPPLSPADSPLPPPLHLPTSRVSDRISDLTAEDGDHVSDLMTSSERSRSRQKETFRRYDSRSLSPKINRVEVRPMSSIIQRSLSPPPILETKIFTEKLPETHLPSSSPSSSSKVRHRTIIRKRVSQEEFDEIKSLHEALDAVIGASETEEGLTETDLLPLNEILTNIQSTGNQLSNEVSHLMFAKEELFRAKQQIELQQQLNEMGENAPRWKVRNRLQQATKLGMHNFSGISFLLSSFFFLSSLPP